MVVAAPPNIKEIEVFRSGVHTSSNGTTLSFTQDHLHQIANSYDPSVHEAPVIVGHAYATSPAYGWVESLKVIGDRLVARIKDLEPQFVELVKARRYSKISSGLYTPESPSNPYPGSFSLREVSFLGAQPPAIKGLKPVEFAEEEGVLEFRDWDWTLDYYDEKAHPRDEDGRFAPKGGGRKGGKSSKSSGNSGKQEATNGVSTVAKSLVSDIKKDYPTESGRKTATEWLKNDVRSLYNKHGEEGVVKALVAKKLEDRGTITPKEDREEDYPGSNFELRDNLLLSGISKADTKSSAKQLIQDLGLEEDAARLDSSRSKRAAKTSDSAPHKDVDSLAKKYLDEIEMDEDTSIEIGQLRKKHQGDFGKEFIKERLELNLFDPEERALVDAGLADMDWGAINQQILEKRVGSKGKKLSFMEGDRFIATVFQRLRDYFIDKEGLDAADKVLPADLVQMIYESANMPDTRFEMLGQLMMRVSELEQQVSQQPIYTEKHMTEEKELEFAEKQRQLEIQQAELAKQAGLLAKRQAELDKKEDLDFCESLIKEGKVLPKERTNLMAIFSSLRKSDSTVNFGEGGELSAVEAIKSFVKEHPPVIAFGEFSAPEKALPRTGNGFDAPDGYEVDPEQAELYEKAQAYMEAHPGVDFLKAVEKIGG